MKKLFNPILTLVLVLCAVPLLAQEGDNKEKNDKKKFANYKERSISKSYPASGNTLNIDNQFGDVKITTWDKNEIKVDIHIDASSNNKEMADKTFEQIDVKDSQEGKEIKFKTTFNSVKIDCHNCSNTMSIDYDIHMPSTNALNITNSFGNIDLPDYTGNVSLESKYGNLTVGKLSHPEKVIVEFGKAVIKSVSNTNLTFKYGSFVIDDLSGTNKMTVEFCDYSRVSIDNDLTSLKINESYSTLHIKPVVNLSVSYDVSTSYGSFTDKSDAKSKRTDKDEYGFNMDQHFEGKSGTGAIKIDIKSSFGNIMVGGTEADMNAAKNNKEKNKDKNKRVI